MQTDRPKGKKRNPQLSGEDLTHSSWYLTEHVDLKKKNQQEDSIVEYN